MKYLRALNTLFLFAFISINAMNKDESFANAESKEILSFTLQNQYKKTETAKKMFAALARTLFDINNGTTISVINSRAASNHIDKTHFFSMVNALKCNQIQNRTVIDIADFIEIIQKPVIKSMEAHNDALKINVNALKHDLANLQQQANTLASNPIIQQSPATEKSRSYSRLSLATISALSLMVGVSIPTIIVPSVKQLMSTYFLR